MGHIGGSIGLLSIGQFCYVFTILACLVTDGRKVSAVSTAFYITLWRMCQLNYFTRCFVYYVRYIFVRFFSSCSRCPIRSKEN